MVLVVNVKATKVMQNPLFYNTKIFFKKIEKAKGASVNVVHQGSHVQSQIGA